MIFNPVQAALYQRLQAFEIDDPTHEFGFTRHLLKNHGWTDAFAQRAIAEYKKFAFLAVVAQHQVVPSDQVDQVWHAHLLLTKSYWGEFCPKILEKNLHHHPARGGQEEREQFHKLYDQTIASYRQYFGEPPTDIWSPPDRRFGADLKMRRINLSENWVIPKFLPYIRISQVQIAAIGIALITIGCTQNPSITREYKTFWWFICIALNIIIIGLALRYRIQSPAKQPQMPELDHYEIAYLAGGSLRSLELAIVILVQQGYLLPSLIHRTFTVIKNQPDNSTTLERAVMRRIKNTPDLKTLRAIAKSSESSTYLRSKLEREKLLITNRYDNIVIHFLKILILILVFGFVLLWLLIGLNISLKVGNFVISNRLFSAIQDFIMATGFILCYAICIIRICCDVPSMRTRWGNRVLADIRKNHDVYNLRLRFALHGHRVLSGGVLNDLKQLFVEEDAAERRYVEEDAAEKANHGGCGCGC